MKLSFNKNSLAILSILAGIVYLVILLSEIGEAWEGATQGFKSGMDSVLKEQDDDPKNDFETEFFLMKLKVKDKRNYYPDSILNRATNDFLPARIEKIDVVYQPKKALPLWNIFTMFFLGLLALPILVLLVFIPIQFYKLIFSLYKNSVFTSENVNRIQKIGVFYIIIYAYLLCFSFYQYFLAKSVIDLDKYEIARPDFASESLLIGLVALIFATVLKRAIAIKEEQDLTI
ncbi:DUF2975 domain-containing protein [Petrimonas sp.]|uniref:DUF2975 domain-containing protein n=1 Tax=Petrimonas sp. TaxID=2023866 RepID=UPI003F50DE97